MSIEVDVENYSSMEDTELDEESINWVQLFARVFSLLLLILIIVFFCLGFLKNQKILILSGIVGGVLILVFLCTFGCAANARKYCVSKYHIEFRTPSTSSTRSFSRTSNKGLLKQSFSMRPSELSNSSFRS